MPFVNFHANGPERITHLSDQWRMARNEWTNIRPAGELNETALSEEQREALARFRSLTDQLMGREAK